jgi:hypothetical protein
MNVGGKILEKVIINRINYVFSHDFMNNCQCGFMPQRSTVDAVMEVRDVVRESLPAEEVIILVSPDVKGAFDDTRWPSNLNGLRACECPRNLYDLTKSYLSQQTTTCPLHVHEEIWRIAIHNYCISRLIRNFFPEKCDLNSNCVLYAEGKYL